MTRPGTAAFVTSTGGPWAGRAPPGRRMRAEAPPVTLRWYARPKPPRGRHRWDGRRLRRPHRAAARPGDAGGGVVGAETPEPHVVGARSGTHLETGYTRGDADAGPGEVEPERTGAQAAA